MRVIHKTKNSDFVLCARLYPIGSSSMFLMYDYTLSVINTKMLSFRVIQRNYMMSFRVLIQKKDTVSNVTLSNTYECFVALNWQSV